MASTLYNYLQNQAVPSGIGSLQNPAVPSGIGNLQNPAASYQPNMMQQFNEFSKTISDPKAEVEKLLANGQMSQEQFNMLGKMANNMMGKRR